MDLPVLTDSRLMSIYETWNRKGIKLDGVWYPKGDAETPIDFINRVRNEHYAWLSLQEASKARTPGNSKVDDSAADPRPDPRTPSPSNESYVQKVEESLEGIITQQKNTLVGRIGSLTAERAKLVDALRYVDDKLTDATSDLTYMERWLMELKDKNNHERTPEANRSVG